MPMVETSVAVATPPTTAPRITNGSASAGSAIRKLRAISRTPTRGGVARSSLRAPMPDHQAQDQPDHQTRQQAAGEQRRDRDAGDRADGDQDQAGRDRLGLRAGRRQQRHQIAALAPRFSISGNSTGATAAMSAAFEPEMPETRYIAAIST